MSFPTYFAPVSTVISNISNDTHAIVTTTTDHGYQSGMVVTIFLPKTGNFGMTQFPNDYSSLIIVGAPNQFAIELDTTSFDPFVLDPKQSAQAIVSGVFFSDNPPIYQEAEQNSGTIIPETSWINTTFPWVNNPTYVRP